jgi:hypothetical protein
MKIKAIVGEHTDEFHTAFRTEPALTEEVFEEALLVQGMQHLLTFSRRNGFLIVRRSDISKADIESYETALSNAEKAVESKKGKRAQQHQTRLNYRSTETDLPVE